MSSVNWGHVKETECSVCGKWMSAYKKNKQSPHRPKGQPTASKDCSGSDKTPSLFKDFNGNTYDSVN
jgi:hypothetical protein